MNIEEKKEVLLNLLSDQVEELSASEGLSGEERTLFVLLSEFAANDHKDRDVAGIAKDIMVHTDKRVSANLYALAYIASVIVINICVVSDTKSSEDDVLKMATVIFIMNNCLARLSTILTPRTHEINVIVKKELLNAINWYDSMAEQIKSVYDNALSVQEEIKSELKKALEV